MDGSKPRRYRAIRQAPGRRPSNQRFSSLGSGVNVTEFAEPLRFVDLAPLPPSGIADNLLYAKVKEGPISLKLTITDEIYGATEARDTIELVLNGKGLGKELVLGDHLPGTEIDITLALEDHQGLPEGRVEINYVIHFRSSGDETANGPPGQYYVTDYTAPGWPLLGALVFSDDVLQNGVTEASLVGTGANAYLPARVPGYTGLAPGDVITGIVGGIKETIDAIPVGDDFLELHFMRDFIAQHEDGRIPFNWFVTDRPLNESEEAEEVTLSVLLKGIITDLATPLVPAYDNDVDPNPKLIDEADARAANGLQVVIPANGHILAGDVVLVLWGDLEVGPVPIDDPAGDPLATVGVPYATVRDAWVAATGGITDAEQTVDVSYRIVRHGQSAGEPKIKAPVKVNLYQAGGIDPDPETPENGTLGKAVLKSASADAPAKYNIIPPEDFAQPATITIPWLRTDTGTPAAFIDGDTLRVRYGKINLPARPITAQDVTDAKDIDIPLTVEDIRKEGSGVAHPLQYFIERKLASGGPNTSNSPIQTIDVSGPDELPGGGTLPVLSVPEAVGTIEAEPDRLSIMRPQARDGTNFIIPAYKNQNPLDTIVLTVPVYRSSYTDADHDNERPANGEGVRDITMTDIHPEDATSDTHVHITEVQLMHYELPNQSTHGHVTYTVTGVAQPPRPVTSAMLLLDIDSRGSS